MKCFQGRKSNNMNHYGKRDEIINDYMVEAICLRCKLIETWEHIMQCNANKRRRPAFAKDLLETLLKNEPKNAKEDVIILFVEDIMKYV